MATADMARSTPKYILAIGYLLLGVAILIVCQLLLTRLGPTGFVIALVGTLGTIIYGVISFRTMSVPLYIWILSVGGFRFLWSIRTPILPDLFLDRITMVWLSVVFMIKFVAERRRLRGPFAIEILLLAHAAYILILISLGDRSTIHEWTMSIMIPYAGFVLAKNIITGRGKIRSLLWMLFGLSTYYNLTAVAEKYDIAWLVWPKYIMTADVGFIGRSLGPFLQAPLFGTVIGLLLPVHLYFLGTVNRGWVRIVLFGNLLLGLAGLYFTYTRGSWITGVVALIVTVVLNRRAYARYLIPIAAVAPIIAIGFLGLAQDKFMKERVENEDTIGSRFGTAVTALRMWRDHPLFGVGYFEYRNVRDHYIQPVEVPGLPTIRFSQFRNNAIHDIYLGPLAETGLLGTGLQMAIYVFIFRRFVRKRRESGEDSDFREYVLPVFGGLMSGYMIGGLAIDYRFFSIVGMLFLVAAGVMDGHRDDRIDESLRSNS
jgi:O-antigen ligase